jgi:hypothetical protein
MRERKNYRARRRNRKREEREERKMGNLKKGRTKWNSSVGLYNLFSIQRSVLFQSLSKFQWCWKTAG